MANLDEIKLLVLAGGFGTRLRTEVDNVPKALAPVGDKPFLQLQIENWLAQGVRCFVFLLHHQADQIIEFLKSQTADLLHGCSVNWSVEPNPMDTGGAIAYAIKSQGLSGDFMVTNSDTWLGSGIQELYKAAAPSIAVISVADMARYGEVIVDESGRVCIFKEKSGLQAKGWINAGLCHLNTSLFDNWCGHPMSLERNLFPQLVNLGLIRAVPLVTSFVDIGVPDDYRRFCAWEKAGRRQGLL